jgi:hypothetical protein
VLGEFEQRTAVAGAHVLLARDAKQAVLAWNEVAG